MPGKRHQAKAVHDGSNGGLPLLFIRLPVGTGPNVLQHRHVGKQGVVLEHQPRVPLLGGEIDSLFGVEQHHIVHHDPPLVRSLDARDALEGHALAGTGGTQQGQRFIPCFKGHL